MRWASALHASPSLPLAVTETLVALKRQLEGAAPDLLVAFFSPHHIEQVEVLSRALRGAFPGATLIGCSGGGVLGGGVERERSPAICVTAACLPDVAGLPFYIDGALPPSPEAWRERLGVQPAHEPAFLLLPDPFSAEPEALLAGLDAAFPGCPKVGGLASGGSAPRQHRLLLNEHIYEAGAVGLALYGDLVMDTAVAQGARPVGPLMEVDTSARNLISRLGGRPAIEALDAAYSALSSHEQALFRRSPMLGVAIDAGVREPGPGDFLVRNLLGFDRRAGVLAVAALVEAGQRVRLHVRDADASAQDLRQVLSRAARPEHRGALMFSCLGRGALFYGAPDHDSRVFAEACGPLPLGGFFCNGELGPVHAKTWLHAYTSAFGLFRPRGWS